MTVKEFMRKYRKIIKNPPEWIISNDPISNIMRPWIVCEDGFKVSVQASSFHYCSPMENLLDRDYEKVELGFPSVEDSLIIDYAEDPDDPTQSVYGWVPIEVVEELVEKHGGIKMADPKSMKILKNNCDVYSECSW